MPRDTEKPIRIRLEHTRYPQMGAHAGYAQLARHLDRQHFKCDLHGASDSDADFPRWLSALKPWLKREILRRKAGWYKLSDLTAEGRLLLPALAGHRDIVHFLDAEHSGRLLPRAAARMRLAGLRTIATVHQPPSILETLIDPAHFAHFDAVIAVAPSQCDYLKRFIEDDRLHVILHGVDTTFFTPSLEPKAPGRLRCVTVGHWLRDWDILRSVVHRLPDIDFDIVTGKPVALEDASNVQLHRAIDDAALLKLYRSADVLLLPLSDATANNTLLEGLACGLPVVTSDLAATRAYLPEDAGIFVSGKHPDGYVAALRRLGGDPAQRTAMGHSARLRADALAWPQVVKQYEALYRAVLDRPPVWQQIS